jgi:predicted small secreted protein
MKNTYSRFAFIGLLLIAVLNMTACNTVQGVGKDIKKAGESIEKASDKGRK